MCSICGYYKLCGLNVHTDFVANSFELMRHRGPDNERFVDIDDRTGFGHQRLSIIDTHDEANQPMKEQDGYVVFNGEIYNYLELKSALISEGAEFTTTSDTEVLLKGLMREGAGFLNKTNGMFAFAFYDKRRKSLMLARDRFGVKPLHYMFQEGVLYFASEIKPLIRIKKSLMRNLKVYNSFIRDLATDYDDDTFIDGIKQLAKGSILMCEGGEVSVRKWYFGNDFNFDEGVFEDGNDTVEFTEQLLVDAIAKRLRADVPVCITLSGGLDSTTIYTLTKECLKKDIKAFTFIHPGSKTNELEKVQKLVKSCNDIVCCIQSDHQTGIKDLKEALRYLEFPTWNPSAIAYMHMYEAIRSSGFKVVIEGHGSDEQLGGYPGEIRSAVFGKMCNFDIAGAKKLFRVMNETVNPDLSQKQKSLFRLAAYFMKTLIFQKRCDTSFDAGLQYIFDYKILPIVLRTFDRLTMRSSVESRSPFMDYRVVEFFKKMPMDHKVSEIGSKAILREILKKHKKDFIYSDKRKIGFASDLPKFFNSKENKAYLASRINTFDIEGYENVREKALKGIEKEFIDWADTSPLWEIAALSISDGMYGI